MSRAAPALIALTAALAALPLGACRDKARDSASGAGARAASPGGASQWNHLLAINLPPTQGGRRLTVQSAAFRANDPIPDTYSAYGRDVSPPLRWSEAPYGTQSIVVLLEDPDAPEPKPYVHWVLYNLPPETIALPEGVPKPGRLKEPSGALQGRNSRNTLGYFGPRPPAGDPPHHYHFQVFALDTKLEFQPGVNRQTVLNAMAGHVLAKGELVGTYQRQATGVD